MENNTKTWNGVIRNPDLLTYHTKQCREIQTQLSAVKDNVHFKIILPVLNMSVK